MLKHQILDEVTRDHIRSKLAQGSRLDGRELDQYRPIQIQQGAVSSAEGSALVSIGSTQVLVGVKLQLGEPFPDSPNQGGLITHVELVPVASPIFEPGPPHEDAIELARLMDRAIRESQALPLEELVVDQNRVWIVYVDAHVLDHDGNLADCCILGAVAALLNSKLPLRRYGLGDTDPPLKLRHLPAPATLAEIDSKLIADPCYEEELAANAILTLVTREDGAICCVQKGWGELDPKLLDQMLAESQKLSCWIRDHHLAKLWSRD